MLERQAVGNLKSKNTDMSGPGSLQANPETIRNTVQHTLVAGKIKGSKNIDPRNLTETS